MWLEALFANRVSAPVSDHPPAGYAADLRAGKAGLAADYERGSIVSLRLRSNAMPAEAELHELLHMLLNAYETLLRDDDDESYRALRAHVDAILVQMGKGARGRGARGRGRGRGGSAAAPVVGRFGRVPGASTGAKSRASGESGDSDYDLETEEGKYQHPYTEADRGEELSPNKKGRPTATFTGDDPGHESDDMPGDEAVIGSKRPPLDSFVQVTSAH